MPEFLGMPDPNEHRYPLPAHNNGVHEFVNCGDPDFCCHDIPSEISEPLTIPIPNATEPKLVFVENAEKYRDIVEVDTAVITQDLIAAGFDPELASSFAIVFHDKEDMAKKEKADKAGWFDGMGFIDGDNRTKDYENHKLAIHVILPQTEAHANKILWHEFGHSHEAAVQGVKREAIYNNDDNIRRTRSAGKGALAAGVLDEIAAYGMIVTDNTSAVTPAALITGVLVMTAGIYMKNEPKAVLWNVDSGEIYARRYAHQRRKLKPVTFK